MGTKQTICLPLLPLWGPGGLVSHLMRFLSGLGSAGGRGRQHIHCLLLVSTKCLRENSPTLLFMNKPNANRHHIPQPVSLCLSVLVPATSWVNFRCLKGNSLCVPPALRSTLGAVYGKGTGNSPSFSSTEASICQETES